NHDSDYDGLSDYWEWKNGTNPLMKDTDSDSFLDGVEVIMGTDPNDPSSYPGCELFVEIIDELFTKVEFKISFFIHDWENQGIIGANFIIWWNETIVPPGNVNPIGVGYYDITLTPILVSSGDDPILLNMTISATGYVDKYYELDLAVDPEIVNKTAQLPTPPSGGGENDDDNDDTNDTSLSISIIVIIAAVAGVVGVITLLYKKKMARKPE
ncbi:MAG: hypothetical protein ACFFAH_17360, partial [Promethearchaeota archaeon]